MARLPKRQLLERFEDAIRLSGWSILYLSKDAHPARYQIYRNNRSYRVQTYIWNITHGGATRSADEYRIQITGIDRFEPQNSARNLILGWWDEASVFAAWDIRQHLGALSSSPSMQISEGALRQALLTGFAPYVNQNGETAIALRSDFMVTYIQFMDQIHDSGIVPAEANLLEKLSMDPDNVLDEEIEGEVAEKRKFAILSAKRALRAIDFSRRVLSAYEYRCAMCGLQLRLVDGAHILPVAHLDSTDQTANGVGLCALHHRAFDRSLVTFDSDFKIHINESRVKVLVAEDRGGGLSAFRKSLRPLIFTPAEKKSRPSLKFIDKANAVRGWKL